jgi:hypothetical protein
MDFTRLAPSDLIPAIRRVTLARKAMPLLYGAARREIVRPLDSAFWVEKNKTAFLKPRFQRYIVPL